MAVVAAAVIKKSIAIFTYKHSVFSLDMKTKVARHVPRIIKNHHIPYQTNWNHAKQFSPITNELSDETWKQKLLGMSQGLPRTIAYHTKPTKSFQTIPNLIKVSLFRLDIKTKVGSHVPRIIKNHSIPNQTILNHTKWSFTPLTNELSV